MMKSTGGNEKDALARAYLGILANDEKTASRQPRQSNVVGDAIDLMLGDASPPVAVAGTVRADHALAAVLIARAIQSVDDLTRRLRKECPVVTITVGSSDLVDLAAHVMKRCCFGADATVMEDDDFYLPSTRPVLLLARDGTGKGDRPDRGNEIIVRAIHAQAPVIGIAVDPHRHLPRDLVRASDYDLVVPQPDESAISLVIEAVTGSPPADPLDPALVKACDSSDLSLAIRRAWSADACVERLKQVAARKNVFVHDGPFLEELSGYGEAKRFGLELAAEVEQYRRGELRWAEVSSHAALIAGPPGVGKTELARAIAKSANLPLISASISEWNSALFLSGTLRSIDETFRRAGQMAPCLLYIDEFDGISDRSKIRGEYKEYWVQIVHRVMENMSGIQAIEGVAILASTNHPDAIDPALRRAGRLDRTIFIEKPSIEDLRMIFRFYLPDVLEDLMPLALAGAGGTGADVESWTRRAKARARRAGRDVAVDDVLEIIREGRKPMPKRLVRAVSLHESGHLVAGLVLRLFSPESLALSDQGGTARADFRIEEVQTLADIEKVIVMLLSGRAAEEEFLGAAGVTAGAAGGDDSDLAKASRAAMAVELKLGLGTQGQIYFGDQAAETMIYDREVLSSIKQRLARCYARARRLVAENQHLIDRIAQRLAESGYLGKDEIERLVGDVNELAEGIQTEHEEMPIAEDRG